jgi:hypothetical protein
MIKRISKEKRKEDKNFSFGKLVGYYPLEELYG